jgi:hypothetical protein
MPTSPVAILEVLGRLGGILGIFLEILVHDLNLRGRPEFVHRFLHLAAQQHVADGRLDLIKGLGRPHLPVFQLDDVPAEIGLHRLRDFSGLQREGRRREFDNHFGRREVTQIAAIILRSVEAVLLGQRGEILAIVQPVENVLGLLLGAQQDMTSPDALGLSHLGGFLVIGRLDHLLRHLRTDGLEEVGIAQRLGLIERQAALVLVGFSNSFLYRILRQQMTLDEVLDHEGIAQLGWQVGKLADDIVGCHLDFGRPDFMPVDDGDDLVFLSFLGGTRQRPGHGERTGQNGGSQDRF